MIRIYPSHRRMYQLGVMLCIISGILYASFILEFFLDYPLDPKLAYLSEYFALDSPYRLLFATSDLLTAILLGAGLICLAEFRKPWAWYQHLTFVAYIIFAIFTIFDVSFPLECAESLKSCPKTGLTIHLFSSAVVSASVSVIAVLVIARGFFGKLDRPWQFILPIIALIFLGLTSTIAIFDFTPHPIGYLQRMQVFCTCLLLMSTGLVLKPHDFTRSRTRVSS